MKSFLAMEHTWSMRIRHFEIATTQLIMAIEMMDSVAKVNSAFIKEGDTVIAYKTPENMRSLIVVSGKIMSDSQGCFAHSDMIGMKFGARMYSSNGKGFIYLLKMTPELWTLVLPHRTQILYMPDMSFITTMLGISPGKIVIESGTGSGSFSHSIARSIGPEGHLHTFEYHAERAEKARVEFKNHGIDGVVSVNHRDVCKDGFGLENVADAVFLDLPSPWLAVESAKLAINEAKGGRVCSFSPCMEQVQKTCIVFEEQGFVDVTMYEVLIRNYEARSASYPSVKSAIAGEITQSRKKRRLDDKTTNAQCSADSIERISKPLKDMRGHTSYLTFATLLPN